MTALHPEAFRPTNRALPLLPDPLRNYGAETAVKPLAVASILPLAEYGIIWFLLDAPPDPISYADGGANQTNKESHFKGGHES